MLFATLFVHSQLIRLRVPCGKRLGRRGRLGLFELQERCERKIGRPRGLTLLDLAVYPLETAENLRRLGQEALLELLQPRGLLAGQKGGPQSRFILESAGGACRVESLLSLGELQGERLEACLQVLFRRDPLLQENPEILMPLPGFLLPGLMPGRQRLELPLLLVGNPVLIQRSAFRANGFQRRIRLLHLVLECQELLGKAFELAGRAGQRLMRRVQRLSRPLELFLGFLPGLPALPQLRQDTLIELGVSIDQDIFSQPLIRFTKPCFEFLLLLRRFLFERFPLFPSADGGFPVFVEHLPLLADCRHRLQCLVPGGRRGLIPLERVLRRLQLRRGRFDKRSQGGLVVRADAYAEVGGERIPRVPPRGLGFLPIIGQTLIRRLIGDHRLVPLLCGFQRLTGFLAGGLRLL